MKYSEKLVKWYKVNKRDLPFRLCKDPYSIWVSEIMAQQTRIDTMIPYYLKWIEKWPTLSDLSNAKIDDVLYVWQGLGYYNRARKLLEGAIVVKEHYNGKLPDTVEELLKIPGIGSYTAGAIASVAYNKKTPAVDGNVLRVITRNYEIPQDILKKTTVDLVSQHVYDLMSNEEPSLFTQALMEIGALICTPKKPKCDECPIQCFCKAYLNQSIDQYPVKSKAKKPLLINYYTYFIVNGENEVCLSNDDSDGLMKGLLRLPQYLNIINELKEAEFIEDRVHVFSHRKWLMKCYVLKCDKLDLENTRWITKEQLKNISIVTAHRKWIDKIIEEKRI